MAGEPNLSSLPAAVAHRHAMSIANQEEWTKGAPGLGRGCRRHDTQSSDLGTFDGTRYRTLRMASIRVVLAEDNALLREGISRIIDSEPDLELVGQAADLPELLELIEDTSPEVVVTDIRMPPTGTDEGIQAASWLREHKPEVGVVVLSQYKTPSYALALLETGSAGRAYLLKEQVAGADELAQAIRTVAQSGSMIDPQIVDELIAAKSSRRKSDLSWLTPRESEILGEMAKGKSNAAIAASLQVSERAVEKHTNSIFSKLGLTEERDVNRRVKAVLVYLSDPGGG
jgi:DNA-binding NarL/FixJ family response regulator